MTAPVSLRRGTRVTVLRDGAPRHAKVQRPIYAGNDPQSMNAPTRPMGFVADAAYLYEHEGVSWIRGWHAPDSSAVKALLVARAMFHAGASA